MDFIFVYNCNKRGGVLLGKEPFIPDKHLQMKSMFRRIGPLLLVIGVVCIIIAMVDFFTLDFFEEPKYFWLFFVAMPIIFIGFIVTNAGYAQDAAKYMSREMAPVTSETFNYIAKETQEGVEAVAKAVQRGKAEVVQAKHCQSCQTLNKVGANFCNECGQSI